MHLKYLKYSRTKLYILTKEVWKEGFNYKSMDDIAFFSFQSSDLFSRGSNSKNYTSIETLDFHINMFPFIKDLKSHSF